MVEKLEEENDRLTRENELQRAEIMVLSSEIEKKNAIITAAELQVQDLKEDLENIQAEKNAGSVEEDGDGAKINALRQQHQADVLEIKSRHNQQVKTLEAALLRAGHSIHKREIGLQKSHQEAATALKQEITTSTARVIPYPSSLSATALELRSAIRLLPAKFAEADRGQATMRAAHTSAKLALIAAEEKVRQTEQKCQDDYKALDDEWSDKFLKMDAEWRKKMETWHKERKAMVHVLMTVWGGEETGPAKEVERQLHRYKYVRRRRTSENQVASETLDSD